jgi:hypothetical protein
MQSGAAGAEAAVPAHGSHSNNCGGGAQPQASGQLLAQKKSDSRQRFLIGGPTTSAQANKSNNYQDLEVLCNTCFTLIKASETDQHGPGSCVPASSSAAGNDQTPPDAIALIDLKLQKLRVALEGRLQDSESKLPLMRHLTQLRYHIDTALKWTLGCTEVGALSDHTVQQVKQLTATSRVLAPGVYVFSRRIENLVTQKDRELRQQNASQPVDPRTGSLLTGGVGRALEQQRPELGVPSIRGAASSVVDIKSVVSDLDSGCGTQIAETVITNSVAHDVGNMQDANDLLDLKTEEAQRRWFYSQCLTLKLHCPDKALARSTLISDLWAKVRQEHVPIEGWVQWLKRELKIPEDKVAVNPARQNRPSIG